ncbi:MAG: exodeoxyribonuclease V subunit gamma, partial [Desulforhopalus sp.]
MTLDASIRGQKFQEAMFYLHVSNRTENLLHHLAEVIRVDRQPDIFAAELFLVQSQGMERMIGQTMADEFGSFCNYRFYLPLDFLSGIAEKLGMGVSPDGFSRQTLGWRLEALLRDVPGDTYRPVRSYLSGEGSELKRFQLARKLANIFDQYQVMRADMLEQWEKGCPVTGQQAEEWQRDLWLRLLQQEGGAVHRGVLFRQVIEKLAGEKNLAGIMPKRISVFGLHTMPPIFLQFLNGLARHMDVHLFLLSPCRHYWGNIESKKGRVKRMIGEAGLGDEAAGEEDHPLLVSLGRQGRDLQNMMLEGADFALELTSYDATLSEEAYNRATVLQRVQADLLEGRLRVVPSASENGDTSIRIVSCHSKLRELQILKDHLLHLLHRNLDLELRDIVVMAPDVQEYAPLIPAVFADIQHSIADRSVRRRNNIIGVFLTFLNLFNGRFGWSELFDLLCRPPVHPQFQLSATDLETLRQWVVGAGIRWGLSGEQRREAGLADFDTSSWRAGLDRMLMGCAIDSGEFVDGVLPYTELEGRGALPLGGLCQYVDLIDKANTEFRLPHPVADWAKRLLFYATELFGDDYDTEFMELRTILTEAAELITPFHGDTVDFGVMYDWLNTSAGEYRSSSGFLRGQLTFCSMLPMRSIPFQ